MILCLSCVVVFCTVYALILPAITLERKTVCGQEEHSHTEECYSSDEQLTCGKTEHTHTESCYADDKTSEDQSGEDPQQTTEQNQTEGQEQNSGQSQEQNQNQSQNQSQSQDQVQTSDDWNVAQNGENGDTAGTTADETTGVTGEYVLNEHTENITYVKLTYRENGVEKEVPSGETAIRPDDSSMMIKVGFTRIPVTELKNSGGSFTYQLPDVFRIKNITTSDIKNDKDEVIGTITVSTDGKVVVKYNEDILNKLGEDKTIDGDFFVSAQLKLSSVDSKTNQTTVHTPTGDITVKLDPDYYERYGNVTVGKQCSKDDKNSEYSKYTITVTAGEDGCKNVYVVDQFIVDFSGKLLKYVAADPRLLSIHSSIARELKWRYIMKKVNLRDLYPDVYKNDYFVEVTEDVLETIRAAERAEAAYDRRMYRYKAYYSLDCDNGIENAILMKPQTPEMLLEEKQLREQLYAAVMALPEKQAKRIYARYYLGMRVSEIATAEGVDQSRVRDSIRRGLKQLAKYF